MMSSIFYGEIKEDRLNTWKENKNPYDILADNKWIERLGGWDFLFIVDELFTDCVQVDWGSFAYKCTKEQLVELTTSGCWSQQARYSVWSWVFTILWNTEKYGVRSKKISLINQIRKKIDT